MTHYRADFSHRYDAGPSGPARQYWDIRTDGNAHVVTLCLPDGETAEANARGVCVALDTARKQGRDDFKRELRAFLT